MHAQVRTFPLHTLEDTKAAVRALGDQSTAFFSQCEQEGYVVVDRAFNRVKASSCQS